MKTENYPKELLLLIQGQDFCINSTGMSGSQVLESNNAVLKIQPSAECFSEEVKMLKWLEGRMPVPKVLYHGVSANKSYLLMTKIKGRMACDPIYLTTPELLIPLLADALKRLWSADITSCPRKRTLDVELSEIEPRLDILETTQFMRKEGFSSPHELFRWLIENRPQEEYVLSHGDFCLPNIFLYGESFSGYIDLGDAGIADKWRDISLCYRSLKHNVDGTYDRYEGVDPDRLFIELGIKKDEKKLRYYLLLDELF